jgi:hypothetical protein
MSILVGYLVTIGTLGGDGTAWVTVPSPNDSAGATPLVQRATLLDGPAAQQNCSQNWVVAAKPEPLPGGRNGGYALNHIAVVSNQNVWSVGYQTENGIVSPLVFRWNGSTAAEVPTPSISTPWAELDAVSMTGAKDGWTVGFQQTGSSPYGFRALAEHWSGTSWSVATTPNLYQGSKAVDILVGSSALATNDAWAVGYGSSSVSSARAPLAEWWNGSNWTIEPAVSVGTIGTVLLGVDAVNPNDVWAVGYSWTSDYQDVPVTEHWNGAAWSVVPNDPAGSNGVLTGVSASGPGDAWAVGYTDTFQPFTEHWNGSAWSEVPAPSLGSVQLLRSVVDLSPTTAWAVGTTYVGGTTNAYEGVDEYWNGTQWSVGQLPAAEAGTFQVRGIAAVPGSDSLWVAGGIPHAGLETLCDASQGVPHNPPNLAGTLSRGSSPDVLSGSIRGPSKSASPQQNHPLLSRTDQASPAVQNVVGVDGTAAAGLAQDTIGWQAVVSDFDHNGLPDIFLMRGNDPGSLYLNNGNGGFDEVDQSTFPSADHWGCASADVNQDGNQDIFCTVGADHGNGLKASEMYMEGPGTVFTDQASSVGLLDPTGRGRGTSFINANGDKFPDLFVGNEPFRSDGLPHPNRLYINTGHGFVDDSQAGLDLPLGATHAVAGDYLNTGFEDLLICTPADGVHLFENDHGVFTDVTHAVGLPNIGATDAQFVDLNGDGLLDIVLETTSQLIVFLQLSNHTFVRSYATPLTSGGRFGVGDVNGDGATDLFVTQGMVGGSKAPNFVLLNNGSGTAFTQLAVPQVSAGSGNGAYPIDFVQNGLTDFLVPNGMSEQTPEPLQLITFVPAPTLGGISPSRALRGTTTTVTISGTGFADGATVTGPKGVAFSKVVVVNSTTITATMTVSATATTGSNLTVTVTNNATAGNGKASKGVLTVT